MSFSATWKEVDRSELRLENAVVSPPLEQLHPDVTGLLQLGSQAAHGFLNTIPSKSGKWDVTVTGHHDLGEGGAVPTSVQMLVVEYVAPPEAVVEEAVS